jgi:putative N6-adenine-specific DNA methylase
MNWKDFDQELYEAVRNETGIQEFHHRIYASDISVKSILAAKTNARNARIFNLIDFRTADFREASPEFSNGLIMINPPYGERIKGENLSQIYQMIGERLKHRFPENEAWILSSSAELLQHIGLKYATKTTLYNGAMQCSFQKYELFEGSRKLMISKREGK